MTKLFTRVFASNAEDVISDEKLFQKMSLVQQFISPESLDIQPTFQNETSWLVSCSRSRQCYLLLCDNGSCFVISCPFLAVSSKRASEDEYVQSSS